MAGIGNPGFPAANQPPTFVALQGPGGLTRRPIAARVIQPAQGQLVGPNTTASIQGQRIWEAAVAKSFRSRSPGRFSLAFEG